MKKGFLAALAALAIAVSTPVTVFAAEKSPSKDEAQIKIKEVSENEGVKVGMTSEEVNKAWGTSLEAGYVVVFVGEAYVDPETASAEVKASLEQKVNASDYNGGAIFVHHKGENSNDVGATVTLKGNDLSPVCTLKKADKVPNTGDSNSNALWIGALGLSVVLAGAAIFMRKRTA